MHIALNLPLAEAAGFPWMNFVWVLVGITALLVSLSAFGRYLAATHPDPAPKLAAAEPPASAAGIPIEVAAVIAAAVHTALGASARVTSVKLADSKPMWSLEGRREIYSSHRVR